MHLPEDKESIMRNVYQLKHTRHFISEGFSKATLNIRAELWDNVKRLREEGYFVVMKYERKLTKKWDEVRQE